MKWVVPFLVLIAVVAAAEFDPEAHLAQIDSLDATEFEAVAFPFVDARAGNCVVSQVHVNIVMRTRDFKPEFLDMKSIADRINPDNLEWVKIRDTYFASMDALIDRPVLGAPGGDAGEFLLALKVFEELTGYQLRQRHVSAYLKAFLEKTAKGAFFAHTTTKALQSLQESVGATNVQNVGEPWVLNPPVSLVRSLWDQVILPENVGARHFKFLLERPAEYGVRLELTQMLIRAFYMIMWNKEHPQFTTAASKLVFLVTEEPHAMNEAQPTKGLINVLTGPHCLSEGLAPAIQPKLATDSVYITHYDAVQVLRRDLARFFTLLVRDHFSALNEVAMLSRMNVVGRHHLQKTVKYLTGEIPIYSITFI